MQRTGQSLTQQPALLICARDETDLDEYMRGWKLSDIMNQNGDPAPGIVTTQDEFAISWSLKEAKEKVNRLLATSSEDEAREYFRLCSQEQWNYKRAKQSLSTGEWQKAIKPILYRPFDTRIIVYDSNVAVHRRERVMRHMLAGNNIGLMAMRQVALDDSYSHFGVTRSMVDNRAFYSNKGIQYLFPLYLYPAEGEMQLEDGKRRPNLSPEFIKDVSEKLGLKFIEDGKGDLKKTFSPEDIFNYAYAIFHSPTYRTRYAEFLKTDFPRLPLTSDIALFRALAAKGAELVALHLMESSVLNNLVTSYPVVGSNVVDKVAYDTANKAGPYQQDTVFRGRSARGLEFPCRRLPSLPEVAKRPKKQDTYL